MRRLYKKIGINREEGIEVNREFRGAFGNALILSLPVIGICIGLYMLFEHVSLNPNGIMPLPQHDGGEAGFFTGCVHGCLVLVSAIAMCGDPNTSLYQIQSGASAYTLGYVLGGATVGLGLIRLTVDLAVSALTVMAFWITEVVRRISHWWSSDNIR